MWQAKNRQDNRFLSCFAIQVGSDIFVVGGANSKAGNEVRALLWRDVLFFHKGSVWSIDEQIQKTASHLNCTYLVQTTFGDAFRLDLVRRRWTRLEQSLTWPVCSAEEVKKSQWPCEICSLQQSCLKCSFLSLQSLYSVVFLILFFCCHRVNHFRKLFVCNDRWWLKDVKSNQPCCCSRNRSFSHWYSIWTFVKVTKAFTCFVFQVLPTNSSKFCVFCFM